LQAGHPLEGVRGVGAVTQVWDRIRKVLKGNAAPSLVMGLISLLCLHVHIILPSQSETGQAIFGTLEENYLTPFSVLDLFWFLLLVAGWLCIFAVLRMLVSRVPLVSSKERGRLVGPLAVLIMTVVIILLWMPYILSWAPGGIYSDTSGVINMATGIAPLSNQHTVLYVFAWRVCTSIGGLLGRGMTFSAMLMTLLQASFMAFSCAYTVAWLSRNGICRAVCIGVLLFFGLVPMFPLSAISLWKDVFFSAFLLLFSLSFLDVVLGSHESRKSIVTFCALLVLVAFSRNNGIYISLGSALALVVVKWGSVRTCWHTTVIASLVLVVASSIVQGPIYGALGIAPAAAESIGMPLQQVARTIATDGSLTDEERDCFSSMLSEQGWKENYRPLIVDTIKWADGFDSSVLNNDKALFWRCYLGAGLKNPGTYAEAILLGDCGFWDPWVGTNENVACYNYEPWSEDISGVKQVDLLESMGLPSLRQMLEPTTYPSSGLFAWLMLICVFLLPRRYGARRLLFLAPMVLLWLTLIIATPIAYSMRYFFAAALMTPVFVLLPFVLKTGRDLPRSAHMAR
jgi:hypothetical protein